MISPRIAALAAASAAVLGLAACNNDADKAPAAEAPATAPEAPPAAAPAGTVVAVAQGNADFTTLVSALQAAGLVETLNGAGPFTVFAPTNAAFEKVPAATRDALMQPAGKADLTRMLTYHVVPGRLDSAALTQQAQAGGGSTTLTTVQGGTLTARTNPDGSISLTDAKGGTAKVVQADVAGSNGVIHAIDTVVMP
jgi:uncharacterized surface protein with fasciclin (FAS1) repeats